MPRRALRHCGACYLDRGSSAVPRYRHFGRRAPLAAPCSARGWTQHETKASIMNSSHVLTPSSGLAHDRFALPRYRVCRLSQNGEINRRVTTTDSAEIAVLDFIKVSPLHDGDHLYVWDRQQKRIVAQVEWIDEPTTFGTSLRVRTNQFYDHQLANIARRLCQRAEIRHAIVNGIAV